MIIRQLFDRESSTYTYLVADPETRKAALIDPVREQVERDIQLLEDLGLDLEYALETHVHADHVTASGILRQRLGVKTVHGSGTGAGCPDILADHGEALPLGSGAIEVRHTPGHTAGCVTYVVEDDDAHYAFTGDALFIRGCGRTDFQQGDASTLYDSVHGQIFSLPDDTVIYPGHDYGGRTMSTVGEERALNPRLGGGRTKAQFVEIMNGLKLGEPKKMKVAVPANMHCGLLHSDGWAPIQRTDDEVPEVDVEWVRDNLGRVRLIDVRRPDELVGDLGAIAGAENVPLDRLSAAMRGWADKEEHIVVFCRSGGRSGTAARLLEQAGFANVASMRGGMTRWRQRVAA